MNVEVNWLAVVLALASSLVVGTVWYTPSVFGNKWMKLVGLNKDKINDGGMKAIAVTIVVSFFTAYVLAHVTFLSNRFYGGSWFQDALTTAFWMWLGFTAARMITHDAFERRPLQLTLINTAHELVTLLAMGFIIGLLRP